MSSKVVQDWLDMVSDGMLRISVVAGVIAGFTDWSHAGTFISGVMLLYAWHTYKYHHYPESDEAG